MSGEGPPRLEVADCGDMRVGVVAALWHQEVMEGLLAGALRALSEAGITQPTVLRPPRRRRTQAHSGSGPRGSLSAIQSSTTC